MNLSANAHLRADDEIRVDVVEAHDSKTESYLRIHLGGPLVVFPKDTAQAVEIAEAILAAVEAQARQVVEAANQQLADSLAACTGARSVSVTDRGVTATSR